MTAGVYALIDPVSDLVMYVGQSSCIEDRIRAHLWKPAHPVAAWMLQVKAAGERPLVKTWEVEDQRERDDLERRLIADNRISVLNINSGGLSGFYRMRPLNAPEAARLNRASLLRNGLSVESISSPNPTEVMLWILERLHLGGIYACFSDGRKLRHNPDIPRRDFRRRLAKLLVRGSVGFNT